MIWKRYVLLAVVFGSTYLSAQNQQLLFNFGEIPQSLLINPGQETDVDWFASIPLVSGIYGQAGSSGVSVNDIFASDGVSINDKVRDRMVNRLGITDEFTQALQIGVLYGGYRGVRSNNVYSFGMYLEMDNIVYWPQDYAQLLFNGNANQLDRRFDLGDLNARGSALAVYHFGVQKKWNKKLTVGLRAKIYSGIVDYNSTQNNGFLVNTLGENNRIATTIDADLQWRSSGFGALNNVTDQGGAGSAVLRRVLFGGDLGLGTDLGFTYRLNQKTIVTGSLLDLGFTYQSGDVFTYSLTGAATIEGIEIDATEAISDTNIDYWQNLVDEVETQVPFTTTNTGYITFRPTRLYASIIRDFGKTVNSKSNCFCDEDGNQVGSPRYKNSIGGQIFAVNRPRGPQTALTGFYVRRFGNIATVKGTYTIDKYSFSNVGLALSVHAGPVNFYIMADNLLSYQNIADSQYASFQLGLNILSWRRRL